MVQGLQQDGYLVVTWANWHYQDFVMTWVAHVQVKGETGGEGGWVVHVSVKGEGLLGRTGEGRGSEQ